MLEGGKLIRRLSQLITLAAISLGGCFASPSFGDGAPLTGTRIESAGEITTVDNYATDGSDFTLNWLIVPNGPLFEYTYVLSGYNTPGIGLFIISLSSGCSADPDCITSANGTIAYGVYPGQGNSTPNFPLGATIDGLKLSFGSENTTTYSFTSDRGPVLGDFYLKGGNGPAAYNAGLANPSTNPLDYIARPDGGSPLISEAPEPGSWLLLAGGVLLVALGSRKQSADISTRRAVPVQAAWL
jgi:hypothetical protein